MYGKKRGKKKDHLKNKKSGKIVYALTSVYTVIVTLFQVVWWSVQGLYSLLFKRKKTQPAPKPIALSNQSVVAEEIPKEASKEVPDSDTSNIEEKTVIKKKSSIKKKVLTKKKVVKKKVSTRKKSSTTTSKPSVSTKKVLKKKGRRGIQLKGDLGEE